MATHFLGLEVKDIVGTRLRTAKAPADHADCLKFMLVRNEIGQFSEPAT